MSNVSLADHRKQKKSACPEAEIRSKSIRATRLRYWWPKALERQDSRGAENRGTS